MLSKMVRSVVTRGRSKQAKNVNVSLEKVALRNGFRLSTLSMQTDTFRLVVLNYTVFAKMRHVRGGLQSGLF